MHLKVLNSQTVAISRQCIIINSDSILISINNLRAVKQNVVLFQKNPKELNNENTIIKIISVER